MPEPSTNSSLTLSDLFSSVRAHWRAFIIVVLVCLAIGIASGYLLPDEYAASASLTVEPVDVTGTATSVNMDTERVVASSTSIVSAAVESVPALSVAALRDALTVNVPKGSQVLEFTVTHPSADLAAQGANAVASAYNAQRIAMAEKDVQDSLETLTDRVTALESTKAVEGANSQAGKAATVQIEALEVNIATLNAATFTEGTLVSPAITPRSSTKPSLVVFGGGALVFGILVGGFVALGRARSAELRRSNAQHSAHARSDSAADTSGAARSTDPDNARTVTPSDPQPETPALDSTAPSPAKPRKKLVAPRPARVAPAGRSGEVS